MENPNSPGVETQPTSNAPSSIAWLPRNSSPFINFHFETQENENRERVVQSFRLYPLDPYIYYHVNTTLNHLRAIIPIRQPKLKSIYKSSKITVQAISSSSKETYLPILSSPEIIRYRREWYKGLHLGAIQKDYNYYS